MKKILLLLLLTHALAITSYIKAMDQSLSGAATVNTSSRCCSSDEALNLCVICLESIETEIPATSAGGGTDRSFIGITLPCHSNHTLHLQCLCNLFIPSSLSPTCPHCREDINLEALCDNLIGANKIEEEERLTSSVINWSLTLNLFDAITTNASREDLKTLISAGANIEATDAVGDTPLLHAASCGNEIATQVLLESGALIDNANTETNTTALHMAVTKEFPNIVALLIANNANSNAQNNIDLTPLHLAVYIATNTNILKTLLEIPRININAQNYKGRTPLFYAAVQNKKKAVRLLLEKNADSSIKADNSKDPLDIAIENGYLSIKNLLETARARTPN